MPAASANSVPVDTSEADRKIVVARMINSNVRANLERLFRAIDTDGKQALIQQRLVCSPVILCAPMVNQRVDDTSRDASGGGGGHGAGGDGRRRRNEAGVSERMQCKCAIMHALYVWWRIGNISKGRP